jgi:hypothetical protein
MRSVDPADIATPSTARAHRSQVITANRPSQANPEGAGNEARCTCSEPDGQPSWRNPPAGFNAEMK